eukprot:CAMPEP_0198553602 /NCGR_PEP_ID=MMETSP1462-20131121/80888_1 /TAXON_ID=1333877 /ORGANISM="Brandtodinium nutriculum, Strain RCC3387" /LENGTH=252 /DNA_ID=CAMNT_0044284291 /DNA_START=32 /DNA_END=787 /DNA_ORIENTATION=+
MSMWALGSVGRLSGGAQRMAYGIEKIPGEHEAQESEEVLAFARELMFAKGDIVCKALESPAVLLPELSMALWAMAAVDYDDEDALFIVERRAVAMERTGRTPMIAKHIPRVLWAYGKMRYRPDRLLLMLNERFRASNLGLQHFTLQDCLALMWACNELEEYGALPQYVEAKARQIFLNQPKYEIDLPQVYLEGLTDRHDRVELMVQKGVALGALGVDADIRVPQDREAFIQRAEQAQKEAIRHHEKYKNQRE